MGKLWCLIDIISPVLSLEVTISLLSLFSFDQVRWFPWLNLIQFVDVYPSSFHGSDWPDYKSAVCLFLYGHMAGMQDEK